MKYLVPIKIINYHHFQFSPLVGNVVQNPFCECALIPTNQFPANINCIYMAFRDFLYLLAGYWNFSSSVSESSTPDTH